MQHHQSGDMDLGGEVPAVTEPVPIPDVFVTGLIDEDLGDYVRLTYYVERNVPIGGKFMQERQVVSRVVFPKTAWRESVASFLARQRYATRKAACSNEIVAHA